MPISTYKRITNLGICKYLFVSILLLLGTLAVSLLVVIKIIKPGFIPAFIGFRSTLIGGILFLVKIGKWHFVK